MSFFESAFLWKEAVIASVAVAMACAVVGVWAVLRRVVFLPAALSQVSGLGVVVGLWIMGAHAAGSETAHPEAGLDFSLGSPTVWALGFSLVTALLLGWMRVSKTLSREAVIGVVYIVSGALVIALGDRLPFEFLHIDDILFGNAVAVEEGQMITAVLSSSAILLLHGLAARVFLVASFDGDTAAAHGVPVRAVDAVLFLSMGFSIAVATKTIGAMPVFAYCVIPPAAALALFRDMRAVLGAAAVIGALSAFVGYWLSFSFDLPTGACSVIVAVAFLAVARMVSRQK